MKLREIGIRFRTLGDSNRIPALTAVELFDVESGETIGNVGELQVAYAANGNVEVIAKMFPLCVELRPL